MTEEEAEAAAEVILDRLDAEITSPVSIADAIAICEAVESGVSARIVGLREYLAR